MREAEAQTYANHRRIIIGFHAFTFGMLAINALWSLYRVAARFSVDAVVGLILALALLLMFYYVRSFATTAQDRIIRLEERLRLERLLPPDLAPRISEFTLGQLIAMRFASDHELPDLARRVRGEGIRDRDAIKRLIRAWKPDYLRV